MPFFYLKTMQEQHKTVRLPSSVFFKVIFADLLVNAKTIIYYALDPKIK